MKIPRLANVNRRHISIAMIVLLVVMLCDVIYQIHMHAKWRRWIPNTLTASGATTQPASTQPAQEKDKGDKSSATQPTTTQATKKPPATAPADKKNPKKPKTPVKIHAAIKARNLFTTPPGKTGHGMTLTGVLGKIAIFQDKSKKQIEIEEGKSDKGIKVKSIEGYKVVIEYKGKEETLKLKDVGGGAASGGPPERDGPSTGPRPPGGPRGIPSKDIPPEIKERMKARMPAMRSRRGPTVTTRESR